MSEVSKATKFSEEVRIFNESEQSYDDYERFVLAVKPIFEQPTMLGGCAIENAIKKGLE